MSTNKKIPTPEEIEKEFQEFWQKKYGGTVRLINATASEPTPEGEAEAPEPTKTFDLKFDLKPKEIKTVPRSVCDSTGRSEESPRDCGL